MEQPNLTSSRFVIWNDGTETVDATDVARGNNLRIVVSDNEKILNCEMLSRTRDETLFTIQMIPSGVEISFDFLDPKDGAIIEILHTGTRKDLSFLGTVKGATPLKRYTKFHYPYYDRRRFRIEAGVVLVIMVIYASMRFGFRKDLWVLGAIGLFAGNLVVWRWFDSVFALGEKVLPEKLESYFE